MGMAVVTLGEEVMMLLLLVVVEAGVEDGALVLEPGDIKDGVAVLPELVLSSSESSLV